MTRALKAVAMRHVKDLCRAAGKEELAFSEPLRAFPAPALPGAPADSAGNGFVLAPRDGTAFAVGESLADSGFVAAYGANADPLKPPTVIDVFAIETVEVVDPGWVYSSRKLETRATRQCSFSCTKVPIYAYDDYRLDRDPAPPVSETPVPVDASFFDHAQPLGGESPDDDLAAEAEADSGVVEDPRPQRHGTAADRFRKCRSADSGDAVDSIMDELFRKTTERWERRRQRKDPAAVDADAGAGAGAGEIDRNEKDE